jgi:DNA polymerase III subunit gamma/tau
MTQMLYTKYRPLNLKDVANQSEVIDILLASIEGGTPASAYIFTGGRGTGKTSIARAFARDLSINEADIVEMDAASNSKIEDIRELSENIYSLPFYSKYKMYILDEVHMLSKNAANAFLKILEEPPAHVIFVLATTDPQKLPETILSRCLQFTLKKPNLKQIEEYLKIVIEKEERRVHDAGIRNIAVLGDGSYRDSLAHLQKVLSSDRNTESSEKISEESVNKILNIPSIQVVMNYIKALDIKGELEIKNSLQELHALENNNSNILFFSKNVLSIARLLLLTRFGSVSIKEIEQSEGDFVSSSILEMLNNKNPKLLSQTLSKIIEIQGSHNTNTQILSFELLLLS